MELILCIPGKRLTPSQAAMHPFLAPEFPYAYLLPQQGDAISGLPVLLIVLYPKKITGKKILVKNSGLTEILRVMI